MIRCFESTYDEEWYQPELTCESCGVVFMYSSYRFDITKPAPHDRARYCPNCGLKFNEYVRR